MICNNLRRWFKDEHYVQQMRKPRINCEPGLTRLSATQHVGFLRTTFITGSHKISETSDVSVRMLAEIESQEQRVSALIAVKPQSVTEQPSHAQTVVADPMLTKPSQFKLCEEV